MYEYKFDPYNCWYKKACALKDTSDCNSGCIRFMEMDYLTQTSRIPPKRQRVKPLQPEHIDVQAFQMLKEIGDDIVNFVDNGENLYIVSKYTGNGKTSWAIKLMLKYFNEIWAGNGFKTRGLFIHIPTFLTQLKNFSTKDPEFERFKKLITQADLVIWDDIASTGLSQFDHTQLLTYLDQRILEGKSNIYTGNLLKEDLYKSLGSRLTSRIWNTATIAKFEGSDRR